MNKLFSLPQGYYFSGGDRYGNKYRKFGVAGRGPQKEVGFLWIFEGYERFHCFCLPSRGNTLSVSTWF